MKQNFTSPVASHPRWSGQRRFFATCVVWVGVVFSCFPQQTAVADPTLQSPPQEAATRTDRIRSISREVYRLLVDVEGAVKGGTAFLVSGRRIVATNNHVIDGGTAFWIGFTEANGRVRRVPLRIIATYPQKDLALLEALDDLPGQPLPLSQLAPEPPMDLYAIGFPAAADPQGTLSSLGIDEETYFVPSVLKGYVSRVLTNRWTTTQLQHQTPIVPGYSGGPLLNEDGAVVGISTSIHKEANGISYGVLAADLAEFAAACSLPVRAKPLAPPRPVRSQQTQDAALDTMNTLSLQRQSVASPENRAKLARAEKLLSEGAVAAARLLCRHLIESTRSAEAYICLARTFDPNVLREMHVIGMEGDADVARQIYEQGMKARQEAGAFGNASGVDLPVGEGTCDASLCRLINTANGPAVFCQRKQVN